MAAKKLSDEQKIKLAIAENLQIDVKDVKNESSFEQDFAIEEVDIVEVIMAVEEKFDVDLHEQHDDLKTVQDVIKAVKAKKDEANKK